MIFRLIFVIMSLNILAFANENLSQMKELAASMPVWIYPYPNLINQLKDQNQKSITIFSYGSLMDNNSASLTLSKESLETKKAAIAFGIRRLFDRDIPIKAGSKWLTPNNPSARGMLNVMPTHAEEDFVNGVVFEVLLKDLPKVMKREIGYNLLPVVILDWQEAVSANPLHYKIAYTFFAPQTSIYSNQNIKPRPRYYELSRDASLQYGELFYLTWFKTTYMADGKTPIIKWENKVLNHEVDTQTIETSDNSPLN